MRSHNEPRFFRLLPLALLLLLFLFGGHQMETIFRLTFCYLWRLDWTQIHLMELNDD